MLDLQEKGIIQMLYDKWWKSPGLTCIRDELTKKDGRASALGADNIGGVFVVLLLGLALAVLTAMFEFFWHSRQVAKDQRMSYCSEMKEELRFAVKCHGSTKQRSAIRRRCSHCNGGGGNGNIAGYGLTSPDMPHPVSDFPDLPPQLTQGDTSHQMCPNSFGILGSSGFNIIPEYHTPSNAHPAGTTFLTNHLHLRKHSTSCTAATAAHHSHPSPRHNLYDHQSSEHPHLHGHSHENS